MTALRAPFPWFGGKSLAAPLIWRAFGDVPNYVEPFAGSLAVLLARAQVGKVETVNDKDGLISNVWRAIAISPDEVAHYADWPVNECDLHARHAWLVREALPLTERLIADPEWFDPKAAGWWIWGLSAWIGSGWCSSEERLRRCIPKIGSPGHGIHAPGRLRPVLGHAGRGLNAVGAADLETLFQELGDRMRRVRVCCGDWTRVLGDSSLGIDAGPGHSHGMSPCGVLLDPPYAHEWRDKRLYREDDPGVSADVRTWAIEHGDHPGLRIALCGLDVEHEMPASWTAVDWSPRVNANGTRERIWLSPHCLKTDVQIAMFSEASP